MKAKALDTVQERANKGSISNGFDYGIVWIWLGHLRLLHQLRGWSTLYRVLNLDYLGWSKALST